MDLEIVRTHDYMYLGEDRKNTPKECFKFVEKFANEHLKKIETPNILDVGCATGDQLWFLSQCYPSASMHGIDVLPELIKKASDEVPSAKVFYGNIMDRKTLPKIKFDAIFMSGVNSIFDEIETWVENLIYLASKNSEIYVFGLFNPEELDVLIKSKKSGDKTDKWETGWNVFSKKSFEIFLNDKNLDFDFFDFDLPIDIEKNENDPLRSWTKKMKNGDRLIMNGLQLVHTFSLLRIKIVK